MNKVKIMLKKQDTFNEIATPNWRDLHHDWRLALALELAEAVESCDWKWWKKQNIDIENLKIELVDSAHFVLSIIIDEEKYNFDLLDEALELLFSQRAVGEYSEKIIINDLKGLMKDTLVGTGGSVLLSKLSSVMIYIGMSYEDFFKLYIGKNVLNKFRQSNGYKEGHYVKMWNGKEDNVYMQEAMQELEVTVDFEDKLQKKLYKRYSLMMSQVKNGEK